MSFDNHAATVKGSNPSHLQFLTRLQGRSTAVCSIVGMTFANSHLGATSHAWAKLALT